MAESTTPSQANKSSTTLKPKSPYRQIRAQHDATTITVYQAYSESIGHAAVRAQKLDASPDFKTSRMTWIKPSWNWMMYRSGYSYKDPRQNCILAIRMTREGFVELLESARLSHGGIPGAGEGEEKVGGAKVVVQWDPERGAKLGRKPYRSIQIGIPGSLGQKWRDEMILSIEDVTERARELKKMIDEQRDVSDQELRELGLLPEESEVEVPERVRKILRMDVEEGS
jgi:Domain of unknown function (DUF4291)